MSRGNSFSNGPAAGNSSYNGPSGPASLLIDGSRLHPYTIWTLV